MKNRSAIIILVFTGILWSTGGVLIKSIPMHPMAIAGLRSGIAAAIIWLYLRRPHFTWSFYQFGAAVSYAGTVILFVFANKLTTAGNAILLQYTAPVYVALFSFTFLKEPSSKTDWIGIGAMLVGLGLFFFDELSFQGYMGNVLAIVSGISFAALTLFLRKQKHGSPLESILLGNLITFLIAMPFSVHLINIETSPWGLLLILGIFQLGVPYILYSIAIKQVTALDAIIFPAIEPILNPMIVFFIIGESLGINAIVGGTIVIFSLFLRGLLKYK